MFIKPDDCSEIYWEAESVIAVIDFGGESRTFRITALKDLDTGRFSTRVEKQLNVDLQPTYPKTSGKYDLPVATFEVWVTHHHPWVDKSTADDAIQQALSFFSGR